MNEPGCIVEKERFRFIGLQEIKCSLLWGVKRKAIFIKLIWIVRFCGREPSESTWLHGNLYATVVCRHFKAVLVRLWIVVVVFGNMPFATMSGAIPGSLECLGEGESFSWHSGEIKRRDSSSIFTLWAWWDSTCHRGHATAHWMKST